MIRAKPIPGPLQRTGEPDLAAAWPFTELAGVPADLTGRYGTPTFSSSPPTWQTGLYGAELLFAITQAITVSPSGTRILAGLSNWTIIAIARTASTSDSNGLSLYSERGTSGNDILKLQRADSSTNASLNTFGLIYRDDAATINRIGSIGVITDDKYHHFAVTKAGTAVRLYLDGVFNNSGTLTATDTMTDATLRGQIGADPATSNDGWIGPIVGVWLYRRALSDGDIAKHFNNPWRVPRRSYLEVTPPRVLLAGPGAFPITTYPASLREDRLQAGVGSFPITGQQAMLAHTRVLQAGTGALPITGQAIGRRLALYLRWTNPVAFRQQLHLTWRVYRISFRKALPLEWDCGIPLRTLSLLWTCVPDAMIVPEEETVVRPTSKTMRTP